MTITFSLAALAVVASFAMGEVQAGESVPGPAGLLYFDDGKPR